MTAAPLVTIVTAAYNRETLVAETIDSVLGQDYPNLEYIVLDDGSSDGTLGVVKRYEDRVRVESHPNMGESRTVNRGFELARGEIIGVVSSDDPLLPGAVRRLVEALLAHPSVVVAYPDWNLIDEHGRVIQAMRTHDFTSLADMVRKHHCLPGPGTLFRREVAEKLGGRDPQFRYIADLDFWYRAGLVGGFLRVPEVLATWRTHSGGATTGQQGQRMADEHVAMIEKFYARTDLPDAVRRVEREAMSSAWYVAGSGYGKGRFGSKLKCFVRAVRLAPLKYLGEYAVRWPTMLASLFNLSFLNVYYRLKKMEGALRRG